MSKICHGDDPKVFRFRACSHLFSCVYENFSEAMKASLSSGTSIAALLPTMLALIGRFAFSFSIDWLLGSQYHRTIPFFVLTDVTRLTST